MIALGSSFLDISSTVARTRHCNPCSISIISWSTDNKIMLSWLDDVTLRNKSIVGEQDGVLRSSVLLNLAFESCCEVRSQRLYISDRNTSPLF